MAGSSRRLFEGFDIDPQRRIRTQAELLIPQEQVARRSAGGAAASWGRSQGSGLQGAADGIEDLV